MDKNETSEYVAMQYAVHGMDPTGDHVFIARFPQSEELEITILDSYHQGITLVLRPNGTYFSYPTGG